MEGVEVFGLTEDPVQAGLQEVQLIQELGDLLLTVLMVTGGQGPVEMLEMAGEGRGRQAVLGGQGAQGEALHQGLVDFRQGSVSADGTALVHGQRRFSVFGKRTGKGYQGRGQRASTGGTGGGQLGRRDQ